MFHTYVQRGCGDLVDFDRASFLMDEELLAEAVKIRDEHKRTNSDPSVNYSAQFVWDIYCILHEKKYGVLFPPDIDPTWG